MRSGQEVVPDSHEPGEEEVVQDEPVVEQEVVPDSYESGEEEVVQDAQILDIPSR